MEISVTTGSASHRDRGPNFLVSKSPKLLGRILNINKSGHISPSPEKLLMPNLPEISEITDTGINSQTGEGEYHITDSSEHFNVSTDDPTVSMSEEKVTYTGNVIRVLNEIRKKYVNNVVIGHLNINSLANKFDTLTLIIKDRLDILVLVETKLDDSFTDKQCIGEGYTKPYRLDRNCNGGGILIYVRKDIPSKELNKHNFTKNIEALFIEINLRKNNFYL